MKKRVRTVKNTKRHPRQTKPKRPNTEKLPKKKNPKKSGKKSAIQAGYAEKERALSLQRKMKAAGIDSTITEIMTDNGKVYRVKSSNYKNARDAERDLNKLRVHGIAGQVTNE
ncbi:cell division protein FtsN [Neisseria cinerea]|uniref:cell division protein FtsN n=1 Tax=Neisseria cinerea TaxID=483 RepID=UPI002446C745|nr:cell division protein FtsN [Neisseria cinerea]